MFGSIRPSQTSTVEFSWNFVTDIALAQETVVLFFKMDTKKWDYSKLIFLCFYRQTERYKYHLVRYINFYMKMVNFAVLQMPYGAQGRFRLAERWFFGGRGMGKGTAATLDRSYDIFRRNHGVIKQRGLSW